MSIKDYLFNAKRFPIKTCASCEYTYLFNKPCPKCEFAYYSSYTVYDSILICILELITNVAYNKKNIKYKL